jgi:hypothetical protein
MDLVALRLDVLLPRQPERLFGSIRPFQRLDLAFEQRERDETIAAPGDPLAQGCFRRIKKDESDIRTAGGFQPGRDGLFGARGLLSGRGIGGGLEGVELPERLTALAAESVSRESGCVLGMFLF